MYFFFASSITVRKVDSKYINIVDNLCQNCFLIDRRSHSSDDLCVVEVIHKMDGNKREY